MKRLNTSLWIAVIMMTSCIPDPLPVDSIPQLHSKIVVSSQVTSNQSVIIFLTKSIGALDASDDTDIEDLLDLITINDATVVIKNNTATYTLDFVGEGVYSGTSIPLTEGVEYELVVTSPSMGTATSTTTVKGQVRFESLEGNIYDTGYDTLAHLRYSFRDPAGENFYMINVQRITSEYEPEDFLNPRIFTNLLRDNLFSQQLHTDELKVFGGRDYVPGDTLGVFLSNISEDYHDFIEVRLDSRYNFADFLGEPANYPTNVEGGLGFFNLYIPDVRILTLGE